MSMLDRYKKTGGFVQLLSLLETSAPAKREKFLELIRAEDSHWAEALRTRTIDMNRIFAWPDETLAEVIGTLHDLTLSVTVSACEPTLRDRIMGLLSHGRRRKIEDLAQAQKPTPQEVATMHGKIIETVRKMSIDGFLRFEKFDPELVVEADIEDKLAKANAMDPIPSLHLVTTGTSNDSPVETSRADTQDGGESRVMEIQALKKRISEMSKENAMLRHELSMARSKLDQIKKIA